MQRSGKSGFSLVEILLTLGILCILAMFTVPSLVSPPGESYTYRYTAMAKDVAYLMMNAYQQYRMANTSVPTSMTLDALTPYMNYVQVVTTGLLDDRPLNNVTRDCGDGTLTCLKLHNGGTLYWRKVYSFGTATTQSCISLQFDPDSVQGTTGTAQHPSKAITLFLYYDGKVRHYGSMLANSWVNNLSTEQPNTARIPMWYSD